MPILNWLTRDEDIRAAQRVPYRLLEEVPDLSAGDRDAGNMLIQGDNLDALRVRLIITGGDAAEQQCAHGGMDHGLGDVEVLLIVVDETPPPDHPAEGALHNPTTRDDLEA